MNNKEKKFKEIIISDEQAQKIAEELYCSGDFVREVKNYIEEHRADYEEFLRKERKNQL